MKFAAALILGACLLGAPLAADEAAEKTKKVYDGLMNDSELYAGEGIVSLASFGEDPNKAKASGRERARANMVESIRVRIVSKTTDTQSMGAGGSKEEVSSQSSSSADLELEGIQYKYLEDFPKAGQLTVLAYLSKEEYQRQNDKRLLGYRPLRGLRLHVGTWATSLQPMSSDYPNSGAFAPGAASTPGVGQQSSGPVHVGMDFYMGGWVLGGLFGRMNNGALWYDPKISAYRRNTQEAIGMMARAGYEWTPWATRFQVSVPVLAEWTYLNWEPFFASGLSVASGLRLRYWTSDRVAFDITGIYHQGLTQGAIAERDGVAVQFRPGETRTFDPSGADLGIGILWNGF